MSASSWTFVSSKVIVTAIPRLDVGKRVGVHNKLLRDPRRSKAARHLLSDSYLDPMHRLWKINEIVHLILTDLEKGASALALACCTKSLTDVALNFLWEDVADLLQLMMCLPPDSWKICDDEFVRSPLFLSFALNGAHQLTGVLTLPYPHRVAPVLELCS